MVEYKVETVTVSEAEDLMNEMAEDGWVVAAVTPNIFKGYGLVITFERVIDDEEEE